MNDAVRHLKIAVAIFVVSVAGKWVWSNLPRPLFSTITKTVTETNVSWQVQVQRLTNVVNVPRVVGVTQVTRFIDLREPLHKLLPKGVQVARDERGSWHWSTPGYTNPWAFPTPDSAAMGWIEQSRQATPAEQQP